MPSIAHIQPESGSVAPTTTMPTAISIRTGSDAENSGGAIIPRTIRPTPITIPATSPARPAALVIRKACCGRFAPISTATRLCPAMPMASSMFNTKFHVEFTT